MNISHKLCVPALQQECLTFLLTHAAGRPIKAMRIAELFEEEELYRESSRFVLDNPGGWSEEELSTLSPETLLKLEKRYAHSRRCACLVPPAHVSHPTVFRRNWFLERVLKLGLTPLAKEYQCVRPCPLFSLYTFSSIIHVVLAVPDLPRSSQLRPSTRGKVETGVQRRL